MRENEERIRQRKWKERNLVSTRKTRCKDREMRESGESTND